ncbi:MAG: hypothetical protein AAGF11_10025 [Myxococcota bacterium]
MNACWSPTPCECAEKKQCSSQSQAKYLSKTKVEQAHINNQNDHAFKSNPGAWSWLEAADKPLYNDVVVEGPNQKKGDASDAGMTFWVIKSRSGSNFKPTMQQVKNFLK